MEVSRGKKGDPSAEVKPSRATTADVNLFGGVDPVPGTVHPPFI